ncbi:hypothetical protein [Streptomyces sp. NPDC020607]|uniref:hypothetical protein n=1 Tax=Streptomyces sp. NPDC020607 TaxID=3365082 RepID=UPI00379C4357
MAKRRAKKPNPSDDQQFDLALDPTTGLMLALTVGPRTTPTPDKPRRRGKKQ